MTKSLLFSGLLMLSMLAACSSNAAQGTRTAGPPTVALSPTYTPTTTLTPVPTTTSTPSFPPTATLPPLSLTFKPAADSFIDQSRAVDNFGTSNGLRVDASPVVDAYLRFAVQGLGARSISRARLSIYSYSASTEGLTVQAVSDNTWGERTLTARNAPALGTTLAFVPSVPARDWITFDVTSYITGEGLFSFGLSTPGPKAISLAARESVVYSPRLVVDLQ